MAGSIVLFSGLQRSGKTFLASLIATYYHEKYDIPVYTNMDIKNFTMINYLTDLPIDKKPKVLLLDELHFYLNSRNFKSQADFIYFLNTICKRNILFLATAINADMIDKNLRIQLNYYVLCKSDNYSLHYRIFDLQSQVMKDMSFKRDERLFNEVKYDSTEIPLMFNFNINEYIKLNENKKYFN